MDRPRKRSSPHIWVPSTYFAEGFPYAVINNVAEVFFQQMGASLAVVGLTSLLHLPWNLKLFWAPLVDRIATKKSWLVNMQLCGAVLFGLLIPIHSMQAALATSALVFFLAAMVSATNDIAIDGYYMEVLDAEEQSRFVGYRAAAYKVSSLFVRGPLLALAGVGGWAVGFGAMALLLLAVGLLHGWLLVADRGGALSLRQALLLPWARPRRVFSGALAVLLAWGLGAWLLPPLRSLIARRPFLSGISVGGRVGLGLLLLLLVGAALLPRLKRRAIASQPSGLLGPLLPLLERPHIWAVVAFVVLFRTGESFLQKMKFPFLNQQLGLSVSDYALVSGTMGVLASFLGTFIGGALIARHGLRRWLWPFLLAQNVLNLLYAALAWGAQMGVLAPGESEPTTLWVSAGVITLEEFGAGLGTAVFMVYLMRLCHPQHRAAHFAVWTALMSVSFTLAGSVSGFLAERIGFSGYFALTFFATLPMMALVPFSVSEQVLSWGRPSEGTPTSS